MERRCVQDVVWSFRPISEISCSDDPSYRRYLDHILWMVIYIEPFFLLVLTKVIVYAGIAILASAVIPSIFDVLGLGVKYWTRRPWRPNGRSWPR